jgi:ubiquitin carboxyl-terminal hydrolase 25/28
MDCRHSLMEKVEQSKAPVSNDEQPDGSTKYVVASYCAQCRYHFTITVDFSQRREGQSPCRLSDEANPMHHLRLAESMDSTEYAEKHGMTKYDSLTEVHSFVCSGVNCPVVLEIKVFPPRLTRSLLLMVTDPAKMNGRGRRVIKEDPERYAGMGPLVPVQVLLNLRQYLLDAKATTDPTQIKKIAKRNKKFVLGFADECDQLFEYLDFIPVQEESSDPGVRVIDSYFVDQKIC